MWETDWSHPESTGTKVMARNKKGHTKSSRKWHLVSTGYLREKGVNTPTYRADSWEVDWSRRDIKSKKVMARNKKSKMPSARGWHWVDQSTLAKAGLKWKPARKMTGRTIDRQGYVVLTRPGMTNEEIDLAEKHGLFRGSGKNFIKEHRLAALKKYGYVPDVVRHINGIKTDNRPENLLAGTTQENTADHNMARMSAMYWRERCEAAEKKIKELLEDNEAIQ